MNSTKGQKNSKKTPQPLRVLVTNAFGLLSKLGEFQHVLHSLKPDVAIVTETKFTPDKCSSAQSCIPGYGEPLRCDHTAQGGGIAVWCRSTLAMKQLHVGVNSDVHNATLWCSLRLCSGPELVIGAVYRSGSSANSDVSVINYIDSCLDRVSTPDNHIILAGDFNVHSTEWLGSNKTTLAGERLEEVCAGHGLIQHVDQATRGQNTLDLVISNMHCQVETQTLPPLGRSDHCVVVSDFHGLNVHSEQPSTRKVWRYNKADWSRLRHFLQQSEWTSILSHHPEEACKRLTAQIQEGMERFIPSKCLTVRTSDPVWWTPECCAAASARNKAWKKARQVPHDPALHQAYVDVCRKAASVLQSAERSYKTSVRKKLSTGGLRDKAWWSTVKRAGGNMNHSDIPLLVDPNGQEHISGKEKADCLGSFFARKCSVEGDLTTDSAPDFPPRCQTVLNKIHFRAAAVRRQLRCLDPSKASGPDGISSRVLKECAKELAKPLARLFNSCLQHGCQPASWKLANVVPIHKRNSKTSVKNYRPVSLLNVMSKVMESIVNTQLMNYLDNNHLLSNNQFGFRRRVGTADLLTSLQHEWASALSAGSIAHVLAVDIQGAFDKVSHAGLISKLQGYGIGGNLLLWLTDYLLNRRLQTVVSGKTSQCYPVLAGVPQGSILGPTLFLLYVNDVEDHLPSSVSLAVYADDTTLYTVVESGASDDDAAKALQRSLDHLASWGRKWRVTFEPTKSQLMTVSRKRTPPVLPPMVFMGTAIPSEEKLKLLGVQFDKKLSFSGHLHHVSVRAHQRLHFFRKVAPLLDSHGRLTVYKGFVRPVMEYSYLVWIGAPQSHLNRLNAVQRRAMQVIGPTTVLQSLHARRMVGALTYLYKLLCKNGPPRLRSLCPGFRTQSVDTRTRQQLDAAHGHQYQLQNNLPRDCPDYIRRSFPYCAIRQWNNLPADALARSPNFRSLNTFKHRVNRHIADQAWSWDVT